DPQPNTPDDHTPPNQNVKISFDIPQNVSVNEPFEVTIHLKGFEANQTLENLRVGIYKEGGRQIGQFSSKDNDYNPPGYSTLPTVKADENGNATIKINAKVLESMEGSKIRLKLGDKTLITTDFK
ncbi:DNA-binding protein, partial [Staphylococcus aureus]